MRLGVLWILFSALSPPPSELHHTKEVDSRQYKEDLGGGGEGGGSDVLVEMRFFVFYLLN